MTSQTEFDSDEEETFWDWCSEAYKADIIEEFVYQPESFDIFPKVEYILPTQLKTKVRYDNRELLKPMTYTPDFKITGKNLNKFHKHKLNMFLNMSAVLTDLITDYYIDVKGTFAASGGDAKFSIVQKALWHSNGIYVNKLIPSTFFYFAWLPEPTRETEDIIWTDYREFKDHDRPRAKRAKFKCCKTLKELNNDK